MPANAPDSAEGRSPETRSPLHAAVTPGWRCSTPPCRFRLSSHLYLLACLKQERPRAPPRWQGRTPGTVGLPLQRRGAMLPGEGSAPR